MSLKTRVTVEAPHATFTDREGGWIWRVLKVYASAKSDKANPQARWHLAVKSPNTFGDYERGDTYIHEVLQYGRLESATDEFKAYFEELRS